MSYSITIPYTGSPITWVEPLATDSTIPTLTLAVEDFVTDGRRFTFRLAYRPHVVNAILVNGVSVSWFWDSSDEWLSDWVCDVVVHKEEPAQIQLRVCQPRGVTIRIEYLYEEVY